MIRFFLKQVSCITFLSLFASITFAQKIRAQYPAFKSDKIAIQSFEWIYNDSLKAADVQINITNKSKLEIASVDIYITAENKNGVMLQNVNNQTVREKMRNVSVLPQETKSLQFPKAFVNNDISVLNLIKLIVTYKNGSLEILTANR